MSDAQPDPFLDLAWRALEQPGDAALQAELAQALAADPARRATWDALIRARARAAEGIAAADAMAHADRSAAIPPERLAALMRPRERRKPTLAPWALAAAAIVVFAGATFWLTRPASPSFDASPWITRAPASLSRALSEPLPAVLASATLPVLRDLPSVELQSPLVAAAAGPLTIAWHSSASTPVQVELHENGRAVWSTLAARSPVIGPELPADRTYELILRPRDGAPWSEPFVTVAADPGTPTEGLASVLACLVREPMLLGEAVRRWQALPESERHSETGVRLGLWLGVTARQPALLAEARAAAGR